MIRKSAGFTLLELMVTIVIVGILAGIAIPSYTSYLASSRRQDGIGDIYRVMAQQERFFLNNTIYTLQLGNGGIGYDVNGNGALTSPNGNYEITTALCMDINDVEHPNANSCIRLEANGLNPDDPDFWLQSDGQKSPLLP